MIEGRKLRRKATEKRQIEETPWTRAKAPTSPLPHMGPTTTAVLLIRLRVLKRLTKELSKYFDAIAVAAESTSQTMKHRSSALRVPFKHSRLFIPLSEYFDSSNNGRHPEASWLSFVEHINLRDAELADRYALFAERVTKELINDLQELTQTIKTHMTRMEKTLDPIIQSVTWKRNACDDHVSRLSHAIADLMERPTHSAMASNQSIVLQGIAVEGDPFIVKAETQSAFIARYELEQRLVSTQLEWQESTRILEEKIVERVRESWEKYEDLRHALYGPEAVSANTDPLDIIKSMSSQAEWDHFASLNHLVPESSAHLFDIENIEYLNQNALETLPIHSGWMYKRHHALKPWKRFFYVLTHAGYLHEYPTPNHAAQHPTMSLYLPSCSSNNLKPPEPRNPHFTVSYKKGQLARGLSRRLGIGKEDVFWEFKGENIEQSRDWWTTTGKFVTVTTTLIVVNNADDEINAIPNSYAGSVVTVGGREASCVSIAQTLKDAENQTEILEAPVVTDLPLPDHDEQEVLEAKATMSDPGHVRHASSPDTVEQAPITIEVNDYQPLPTRSEFGILGRRLSTSATLRRNDTKKRFGFGSFHRRKTSSSVN